MFCSAPEREREREREREARGGLERGRRDFLRVPPTALFLCTAPPPGTPSQGTELLPSTEIIVNTGHF